LSLTRPLARLALAAALAALGPAGALALDPVAPAGTTVPATGEAIQASPKAHKLGRSIALVRRHAERQGVPPDLAHAVMMLESGGDPTRTGPMGEVGLMGVRLATAMMLGFRGDQAELLDPALNATYGVAHLAQAWRIAGGDVCRTLVKYRSHYGEERSARFPGACARMGRTLAAMNSPLAGQTALAQAPAGDEARKAAEARRVDETRKPEEAKPAPAAQAAEPAGDARPVETAPVAEAKPAPAPATAEIKAAPTVDAPVAVAVAHPAPPARPTALVTATPPAKSRTAAKPRSKPDAETGSAKAAKADKPNVTTTGSTKGVTLVAKTRSGGSGKTALTCTAKTCTLERGPKN
jgi:hypothetical protein